jgi:putative oxidoreductase
MAATGRPAAFPCLSKEEGPIMIKKFFATDKSFSTTILRVMLGVVMFPHGTQKLLGWFGGRGYEATVKGFTQGHMHLPEFLAVLIVLTESVGALALVAGFFTRLAALAITVDMACAVVLVHLKVGFFMNWSGTAKGEGFEYHLLMIAIGLALLIKGGGPWSVDAAIAKRLRA